MTLGTKLRALRRARGLSLRAAEEGSGVSASTLSRAERDKGWPDTVILCMLGKFYDVPVENFFDAHEPTQEEVNAFLIDHGYDLDELQKEINALIDKLRNTAKDMLAQKEGKA